jgi:hypothetical protein
MVTLTLHQQWGARLHGSQYCALLLSPFSLAESEWFVSNRISWSQTCTHWILLGSISQTLLCFSSHLDSRTPSTSTISMNQYGDPSSSSAQSSNLHTLMARLTMSICLRRYRSSSAQRRVSITLMRISWRRMEFSVSFVSTSRLFVIALN